MITTKICTKCNTEKELTDFAFRNIKRQCYKSQCKNCERLYRQENAESIRIKKKIYNDKNKEKIAIQTKKYSEKNKDKIREYKKEYEEKNKEKIREYRKEHYINNLDKIKEYRDKNKEKIRDYRKMYKTTETAKASKRNSDYKRRSLTKEGDVSTIEIRELLASAKVCYWCNKKLIENKKQVDHYVALSKGGKHTLSNLVITCPDCNLKKKAKDPFEFALSKGKLL